MPDINSGDKMPVTIQNVVKNHNMEMTDVCQS